MTENQKNCVIWLIIVISSVTLIGFIAREPSNLTPQQRYERLYANCVNNVLSSSDYSEIDNCNDIKVDDSD